MLHPHFSARKQVNYGMKLRIINLACMQRIIMPGICTLKLLYPLVFALNFKVGSSIMTLLAIFFPAWVLLKTIEARDGYHRPNNNIAPITCPLNRRKVRAQSL